jgi:RNA polymerase sigma factor (sigma-70 family)
MSGWQASLRTPVMSIAEPASDVDLLRAVPHDVTAFEDLYRRYVRRVTAFAATRCSCAEDVADVVAQTFVRLLDAAGNYDPARGEPAPFVLGIAANVARDVGRHRGRQRALVSKLAGRDMLDADDIERAEAAIDAARAVATTVGEALDAIPPSEQEMLRLVADGHSPGQAARRLGISPEAGWTRLSRARRRLRTRVSPTTDQEQRR